MKLPDYLKIIIFLTAIISLLQNSFHPLDTFLHIISTVMFIVILSKYKVASNIGKYFVLFGLWMSVVFIPAFHLGAQFSLGARDVIQYDNDVCVAFGSKVFFISCISWLLCSRNKRNFNKQIGVPIAINSQTVRTLMVVMFSLTTLCYVLGVGRMGAAEVVLPFHLTGIVNLARKVLFPALFAIIVENYILRNKKIPKSYFVLYFVWSLFEMVTWLSKSILVMNFLPVFAILVIYYRPSSKTILKYSLPIVLLFISLYPVIAAMRSADKGKSFSEYVINSINLADEENEDAGTDSPLIAPLNRAFMTYNLYTKDYSYVADRNLFNFSRVPSLLYIRGAAAYQTHILDGYPMEAHHSSGTSGLMDPLLHGGYGLCYLMIVLLMAIGSYIDNFSERKYHNITIQLLLVLYSFVLVKNISTFYDGVGLSTLIAQAVAIYIAYRYNYKSKNNV